MLLVMGEALMSPALTNLPFKNQKVVIEIFVAFIRKHMAEYRLMSDRSMIMRKVARMQTKNKTLDSKIMYSVVYFFLEQYFRYNSNFLCLLARVKKVDEDEFADLKNKCD